MTDSSLTARQTALVWFNGIALFLLFQCFLTIWNDEQQSIQAGWSSDPAFRHLLTNNSSRSDSSSSSDDLRRNNSNSTIAFFGIEVVSTAGFVICLAATCVSLVGTVAWTYLMAQCFDRCCSCFEPEVIVSTPQTRKAQLYGLTKAERRRILDYLFPNDVLWSTVDVSSASFKLLTNNSLKVILPKGTNEASLSVPQEATVPTPGASLKDDPEPSLQHTDDPKPSSQPADDTPPEHSTETTKTTTLPSPDTREDDFRFACAICLAPYQASDVILQGQGCQHLFHYHCAMEWLDVQQHDDCPYCRQELTTARQFRSAAESVLGASRLEELTEAAAAVAAIAAARRAARAETAADNAETTADNAETTAAENAETTADNAENTDPDATVDIEAPAASGDEASDHNNNDDDTATTPPNDPKEETGGVEVTAADDEATTPQPEEEMGGVEVTAADQVIVNDSSSMDVEQGHHDKEDSSADDSSSSDDAVDNEQPPSANDKTDSDDAQSS